MTRHPATAAEACAARVAQIREQLRALDAQLTEHAAEAARHPGHWGYPGDLARIAELLDEALGRRP